MHKEVSSWILLKHFSDVKIYWKKSLDERELIDYNELPYYINNREWLLGIGFGLTTK